MHAASFGNKCKRNGRIADTRSTSGRPHTRSLRLSRSRPRLTNQNTFLVPVMALIARARSRFPVRVLPLFADESNGICSSLRAETPEKRKWFHDQAFDSALLTNSTSEAAQSFVDSWVLEPQLGLAHGIVKRFIPPNLSMAMEGRLERMSFLSKYKMWGARSIYTSRLFHVQSPSADHYSPISREWLVRHVRALKEKRNLKRRQRSRSPAMSTSSSASSSTKKTVHESPILQTPLPSQPLAGALEPSSAEEVKLAPIVARTDLVITRNIEWANLLVGFEQENRYVIVDPRQNLALVGFIHEQSHLLFRQFLRTRRPFTASVMDASGANLFMAKRPAWLINSTIYIEVDGKIVGQAHRRWHLWKRIYDLYVGKQQFAVVENPGFWNWTFTVKDENGGVLAEIDRHFRGFGFEFLTDAGQYAIRFGDMAPQYEPISNPQIFMAGQAPNSQIQGIKATAEPEVETFSVVRPLNLLERAVTLALAVSLDNDYFSRHGGTGWFIPFPFFGDDD